MSLKNVVHTNCKTCGERIAEVRGRRVYVSACSKCPRVPGPQCPPRSFLLAEVNLVKNGPA